MWGVVLFKDYMTEKDMIILAMLAVIGFIIGTKE